MADIKNIMAQALKKKQEAKKTNNKSFNKIVGKKKDNSECRRVNFNK